MLETTTKINSAAITRIAELAKKTTAQPHHYPLDEIIELASIWTTDLLGREELIAAQQAFFNNTGKVFHDDDFYNSRISYFIEHFLFERPISGVGQAELMKGLIPYQLFINKAIEAQSIDETAKAIFASLMHARHSLFEVEKTNHSSLIIRDILIPQKIQIMAKQGENFVAFEPGIIFQGFVFRMPKKCHLGGGLIVHPSRAKNLISHFIKKTRKTGPTAEFPFLCKLAKIHLKHIRHQHVDVKSIYDTNL